MTPAEELDRLRLARTEGVGPVTFRRLMSRFATAAEAIDALPGLARSGGRAEAPRVPGRDEAARELERLARLGGRMLFLGGEGYPPLLALLADAPSAIAVLGDVGCLSARAVGLVGARNCSVNGERMAEALSTDLAASGLVVVSGLARGIDAAAHRGAMHVGRTVACVAGGLDCPYPADHAALQAEVAAHGAVVAEAALGVAPQSRHFPRRNRIIAGLSLGVVVVEAALRSGTLITARLAQELHREIFAVPGSPLDPRSRGSNDLIRQGAFLTESAADVLANLPDHGPALRPGGGTGDGEPGAAGAETSEIEAVEAAGTGAWAKGAASARAGVAGAGPEPGATDDGDGAAPSEPSTAAAAGVPARPRRGAGLLRRAGRSGADEAAGGVVQDAGAEGAGGSQGGAGRVQAEVLACLSVSPTPVDEVVRRCHLSASAVSSALLELELAGRIETLPGNRVCLLIDTGP
ncbi:MAG: DNA-processing protein DprA [Janthinobacterium lividum]